MCVVLYCLHDVCVLCLCIFHESEFLSTYERVGANIVQYKEGNAEVTGSPVVPASAKRVVEEGDSVMYSLLVIKNHYQAGHFEGDTFVAGTALHFFTSALCFL